MNRVLAHCDPEYGTAFHMGGNVVPCQQTHARLLARPVSAPSLNISAQGRLTSTCTTTPPRVRALPMRPTTVADYFTLASPRPIGVSDYVTMGPEANYTQYGPQRVSGGSMRRNPRVGWTPGMSDYVTLGAEERPDPGMKLQDFKSKWVGGEVMIMKGEWGYVYPHPDWPWLKSSIRLQVLDAYGSDGDITMVFKPVGAPTGHADIPTEEYPGGTNLATLRTVATTGRWSLPTFTTKFAQKIGVSPILLGGALIAAIGLAIVGKRMRRKNTSRKNPWDLLAIEKDVTDVAAPYGRGDVYPRTTHTGKIARYSTKAFAEKARKKVQKSHGGGWTSRDFYIAHSR